MALQKSNMTNLLTDKADVVEYVAALLENSLLDWQSITITPPVKSGDFSARTAIIVWSDAIEMLSYSDEQPST